MNAQLFMSLAWRCWLDLFGLTYPQPPKERD